MCHPPVDWDHSTSIHPVKHVRDWSPESRNLVKHNNHINIDQLSVSHIYIYKISNWWKILINNIYIDIDNRRKFRSQTSDKMDRWKAELGRGREKRRVEESRSEKRKSQKKEDADARKGRKVAKHCVFPMICDSGGSKSRLAKAAGAEPSGQMRDGKVHAVVARSTFRSQNVESATCSRHFWRFRCRFAWQAQGIVHLVKSEQNVRVLSHFQKPWQAWDIWRGSAKMHFPWQAQYKRHVHERC